MWQNTRDQSTVFSVQTEPDDSPVGQDQSPSKSHVVSLYCVGVFVLFLCFVFFGFSLFVCCLFCCCCCLVFLCVFGWFQGGLIFGGGSLFDIFMIFM